MPVRESYDHGTPSWIDLSTSDPDGAQSFYGPLMGWDFEANPTDQGGEYIMASRNGKSTAGLMQQGPEQAAMGIPPLWNTYITVDDVDEAVGKVEAAGGSVTMPSMQVMDSGTMAVVLDPSGAVVCMWQANQHIGSELVNETGALIWNELITDNPEAAKPFYQSVFGLGVTDQDMGNGTVYSMLTLGDIPIAGVMPPPMEGMPNHWSVYFAVDDADATAAKAAELGGTVLGEVFEVPTVGKMVPIQDPQGAVFMAMQPEDPNAVQ